MTKFVFDMVKRWWNCNDHGEIVSVQIIKAISKYCTVMNIVKKTMFRWTRWWVCNDQCEMINYLVIKVMNMVITENLSMISDEHWSDEQYSRLKTVIKVMSNGQGDEQWSRWWTVIKVMNSDQDAEQWSRWFIWWKDT